MNEVQGIKKKVVRDYIEQIINTGNTSRISNYISSDYIEEYNSERYELGIEGAINHVLGVRKTYPDLKLTIEKQICEAEWVATYYVMEGTHEGEWMGIEPTNKTVKIYGVNLDKVTENKIVEHSGAANLLEPLINIGAIEIKKKK
jgi:predicted ester cyclase